MTKDPVAILVGNKTRLKMMRLFVGNQGQVFTVSDIAIRTKESPALVTKEIDVLKSSGLVEPRRFSREVTKKIRGKKIQGKEKVVGFTLRPSFEHLSALSEFLTKTATLHDKEISKRLQGAGKIKLIIVSGLFIQNSESRVDVLLVADGLKKASLERAIKSLEAEIGRELRYSAFEMADFQYRLDMYDKLVRDVIDYPHKIIVDKVGIEGK